MSNISQAERQRIAQLQAEFLMKGNPVRRCPTHAPTTGAMRYRNLRKPQPDDPKFEER